MPQLMCCMCVFGAMRGSVSEPPVWLWPAGCWEHGEGGWALETSPLTAWVCGGVSHPAEQVSRQPHCKSSPLWIRASLDSSPFITLYLFLSLFSHGFLSHWFSHSLMGVIFFTIPCDFPRVLFSASSLISPAHSVSLFFSFVVSWQSYSSGLCADICVWDYRLLSQAPPARCLCGACRRPCYHHSRSSWRPFCCTHITFRHHVTAAK